MITPPKNVKWRCHHVSDLHIQDDIRGDIGLTFCRIDGCLPFIRLPRNISLSIIGQCGLVKIYNALRACENLRSPLCRSNKKRVFTDFGKPPRYACVGPQVSRNSQKVHDHPSFMDKLPSHHWESLLWLMRRAEESFKTIADLVIFITQRMLFLTRLSQQGTPNLLAQSSLEEWHLAQMFFSDVTPTKILR